MGFFLISLVVNAIVTALIVYRITVYNRIRGLNNSVHASDHHGSASGQRLDLYPLISILMIESGLITFIAQLVQCIMYRIASPAFPLICGCVVILFVRGPSCRLLILVSFFLMKSTPPQGISSTIVLVRVDMGVSYDKIPSRHANSMPKPWMYLLLNYQKLGLFDYYWRTFKLMISKKLAHLPELIFWYTYLGE